MKKSSYTDEQLVSALREAEGSEQPIRDFCCSKGFNETTFYKWKNVLARWIFQKRRTPTSARKLKTGRTSVIRLLKDKLDS
jgi:hypothetical protein